MFLHLGNNCMVRKEKIIGILDLNSSGSTQAARDLLKRIQKKSEVYNISEKGKEKSFILTDTAAYISPISSTTLLKRSQIETDLDIG